MALIAGHHVHAVLEGRGRQHQVGAGMADLSGELPPTLGNRGVDRQDAWPEPCRHRRIAVAFAKFREHHRVEQQYGPHRQQQRRAARAAR